MSSPLLLKHDMTIKEMHILLFYHFDSHIDHIFQKEKHDLKLDIKKLEIMNCLVWPEIKRNKWEFYFRFLQFFLQQEAAPPVGERNLV